ncbi:cysteine-rich KTR domain-containing protein [Bacteroides heparinolyticus]|uniref:cysteine-rich KTR domain-containing protein n=1 Tax=Prevotella heparinolytica TaxID=28113 RepID=UPI004039D49C
MEKTEWIRWPVCGSKTRDRIREDTVLINYPLYCPKCKQESFIDAKGLQVSSFTKQTGFGSAGSVIMSKDSCITFINAAQNLNAVTVGRSFDRF